MRAVNRYPPVVSGPTSFRARVSRGFPNVHYTADGHRFRTAHLIPGFVHYFPTFENIKDLLAIF